MRSVHDSNLQGCPMIGNVRTRANAVSFSNVEPVTSRAEPDSWETLCDLDDVDIHDLEAFNSEAVEALLGAGRLPATPEACADVIYWCARHGAHRVLARVVSEWHPEVTSLQLNNKSFRRAANCDDSVLRFERLAPDALEQATCFVVEKLLCKESGLLEDISLKNLTLDEGTCDRICRALESSPTLEALSIQNTPGRGSFTKPADLLAAAAGSNTLRCLRLRQSLVDSRPVAQSLASLAAGGRLTSLELEDSGLTIDDSSALATALESNDCRVSTLSLVNCFQDAAGIPAVLQALRRNTSVEVLNLSRNDLGMASIDPAGLLTFNGQLMKLCLFNTSLEDVACESLGRMLSANPALAVLDLSWNSLKDIAPLVAGISEGAVLQSLDLTSNPLEQADGVALADLLRKCELQSLDLSFCRQPGLYAPIFDALGSNDSLTRLFLADVGLSKLTAGMLAGLAQSRKLAWLDLRDNAILDVDVDKLIRALDNHRIALQISGNQLPEDQYQKFASALCLSSGITSLVLQPGVKNELALLDELAPRIASNFTLTELDLSSMQHFAEGSAGAETEALIAAVVRRNMRPRPGIDEFFERFVSHENLSLPPELGPTIRSFVEGDEVGARTLHAMRVLLPVVPETPSVNQQSNDS